MEQNIYCTVSVLGENHDPYYLLPTNFKRNEDDYVLGVKANMVIGIIDKNNHLIYDMPAPEELRVYADKVKEFKKDPFWKTKLRRYFGTQITTGTEEDL